MRTCVSCFLAAAAALLVFASSLAAAAADATNHFRLRFPREASFRLRAPAAPGAKFLRAWPDDGSTNWVEFTSRVAVQLRNPAALSQIISGGLHPSRKISDSIFILDASSPENALRQASRLASLPDVIVAYPVFRDNSALHGPYSPRPTDMGFVNQWYLENRNADGSQAGPDMDVRAAWPYTLGQGVTVGVADTGIELTHQELSNNVAGAPHYNFVLGNTNGAPVNRFATGAHGTEVAGLLGAEIDNFRMVGVAPEATLASMVIFDANANIATDEQRMDAYQYDSNVVQIQNHSWGVSDLFDGQIGPTLLESVGLTNAFVNGRDGKGTIIVRSAGDGREIQQDANDSGYVSDPHVIGVSAVNYGGRVASYSNPGADILVGAPSGDPASGYQPLFSTDLNGTDGVNAINYFGEPDLNDYVFNNLGFTGTSASAPQVSGVVALMLAVNHNLTWRDVQAILALSSRHFDFADPNLSTNSAGFVVSDNLGFGIPDAGVAVQLARLWTNLPPATNVTITSAAQSVIPQSGLNVVMIDEFSNLLYNAVALPDLGKQPDDPTPYLPLVDCGMATNPITLNLTNKGALIERGGSNTFAQKIAYAAQAGAAFAIIYNYPANLDTNGAPGGNVLFPLGGTDFSPIPAVMIGNFDGTELIDNQQLDTNARAQIVLDSDTYTFTVTNYLTCEHVALNIQASNLFRGNLRITLTSPDGTRSVLGRYNTDTNSGPADWTYYTTHDFFENSAGVWTAAITDEGLGDAAAINTINSITLTITGVPAATSPTREQILQRYLLPNPNAPVQPNLSFWNSTLGRLSWTASPAASEYQIYAGTNVGNLALATNIPAHFPTTEWFPSIAPPLQFFAVKPNP